MPVIVVVESDTLVRHIFRCLLEEVGYVVHDAARAADALRYCREGPADLAIVDTFLPKEEGLQLIHQLKVERPSLKIVALTGGFLHTHLRQRVLEEGVHGQLDKPFPPSQLTDLVRKLVGPPT